MYKKILIGLLVFLFTEMEAQNKKALIVAIANYPVASGFRSIHSTNDIPLIQKALLKLGFNDKDIVILKDEYATKLNIVNALENFVSTEIKSGDIFYFHFSGHGQQVLDLNGDEVDGFDEAMVCYDAMSEYLPGLYKGQNHFIDDEFKNVLYIIRKKLGPKGHVLTTTDACHSGTITRHIGSARGTDIPLAPVGYNANRDRNHSDLNQTDFKEEDESALASVVSFFGSMANQLNYEILAEDGKQYGSLSYAFSKAVHSIPAGSSYQQLFDRIRLVIQMHITNQIPEASGILAQPVLGGTYLGTPNYFSVKEWQDSNTVIMDAGFLHGITNGKVMGFYKPETRNLTNEIPITIGTVKIAGAQSSVINIPDGISEKDAEFSWLIVKEENFGDLLIHLKLYGTFKNLDSTFFTDLFALPYIQKTENNPDLILLEESNNLVLVTPFDDKVAVVSKSSARNDMFFKLKSALTQYGQSQYLRKLEQENKQIELQFEFILLERNGILIADNFSADSLKDHNGTIVLKEGDKIKIKVSNKGTKSAYFSFLDIQPDHKINVLFPRANESPADYFLAPGKSFLSIPFRINPPVGQELFKLIATKNPINLRPLEQRRGISINVSKPNDPFEKLMNQSYYQSEETATRGTSSSLPSGQVNIYSIPFLITK